MNIRNAIMTYLCSVITLLNLDDITGNLYIYQVSQGSISELFKSKERVYCFDFDLENTYLAIGVKNIVKIFTVIKTTIKNDIYVIKQELEYDAKAEIINVVFLKKDTNLLIATKDNTFYVLNHYKDENFVENTINVDTSIGKITCFYADQFSDVNLIIVYRIQK